MQCMINRKHLLAFWIKYLLFLIGLFLLLEIIVIIGSLLGASANTDFDQILELLTVPLFYLANFFHFMRFNPGLLMELSVVGIVFNLILLMYASLLAAILVSIKISKRNWCWFCFITMVLFAIGWSGLLFA